MTNFEGEIETLAYPQAALFSFSLALVSYNNQFVSGELNLISFADEGKGCPVDRVWVALHCT